MPDNDCIGCGNSNGRSYPNQVTPCTGCGDCSTDATCVNYSGPNFTCIDADTNTDLQTILQAIDAVICENSDINWSSFDYFCLTDEGYVINSAQTFAERISDLHCQLRSDYDMFVTEIYVDDIQNIQNQIDDILNPGLTSCSLLGITSLDNYIQILTKINTAICNIFTQINPSGADWSQCYTVISNPTTITSAFDLIIDWICDLKADIDDIDITLPTFDNRNTCIIGGGQNDTLYNTVIAIRNLLCEKPDFDVDAITFGCVEDGADLQETIQNTIDAVTFLKQKSIVSVNEDQLTLTPINGSDPCAGYNLSLAEDITSTDRFVASNNLDNSPGTLMDKLLAGTNMSLDDTTTPGKVILNATDANDKVKASSSDTTPDYLINKISVQSSADNGITVAQTYNSGTKKVDAIPTLDYSIIAENILTTIQNDGDLYDLFCILACGCNPCTTTTTTTTAAPSRKVAGIISNLNDSGDDLDIGVTFGQLNPSVTWYANPTFNIDGGVSISTGSYIVTSSDTPLTGVVSVTNNGAFTITYHIYVYDAMGSPVSGSSDLTGTINASNTFTSSPFVYGTNTDYRLHIDVARAT